MAILMDREEYIEQAYFFRIFRERLNQNQPTQQILHQIHDEILSTTRLPMAIQFLATEIKYSGLLSSGFQRLGHYFVPFQAFLIEQTEDERRKFNIATALTVLEREANYRAGAISPQGLFVFQLETISRNRLGYLDGLKAMLGDPFFDDQWREYLQIVLRQIGITDLVDLIYFRSELAVKEQRRRNADYDPKRPPLFGEKEGKIARANRGKDPLFLFAALQRQLNYPEVPRPTAPDDTQAKIDMLRAKIRELEQRLKLVESEVRGQLDLKQFMTKPDAFQRPDLDVD